MMKMLRQLLLRSPIIFLIVLSSAQKLTGQSVAATGGVISRAISANFGYGKLAIRDRAISDQRYTGTLSRVAIDWNDFSAVKGNRFGINMEKGEEVTSGLMSAEVIQLQLFLDMLYLIPQKPPLFRNASIFVGPSTGAYFYLRSQQIASTGGSAGFAESIYLEFPLGAQSRVFLPLGQKLEIETDIHVDVVSLGVRAPAEDEEDVAKIVHIGNSPEITFNIKLKYMIAGGLQIHLSTQQGGSKVGAWQADMLSGYSGISFGLAYDFARNGSK